MRARVLIFLLALLPPSAFAQEAAKNPPSAETEPLTVLTPLSTIPDKKETPKPSRALALSLGVTAASWGLLSTQTLFPPSCAQSCGVFREGTEFLGVTGALLGPSLGHLYAGAWRHAALTTSLRVGALLVGPLAGGQKGVRIGYLVALGLSLYDILDAPFAARRAKRKGRGERE